jgi:hypothetical protein
VGAAVAGADVETSVVVEVGVVIVETLEEDEEEAATTVEVEVEAVVAMEVVVEALKVPRCSGKYPRSFVLDWRLTNP